MLLNAHYTQTINFNDRTIYKSAQGVNATNILRRWLRAAEPPGPDEHPSIIEVMETLTQDLNTPNAIAMMHGYRARKEGKKLYTAMKFLGLLDGQCAPDDWRTIPPEHTAPPGSAPLGTG